MRNCIVSWTPGEQGVRQVLTKLNRPTNILIDNDKKSLIIADRDNRRVIRYYLGSDSIPVETILDNISCCGLAMDDEGTLYVTDSSKDEVRRYLPGDKAGEVVAGGNGKGAGLHQLNGPAYVAIDSDDTLYVSDYNNHRVVKWNRGAVEGTIVAGWDGYGSESTQLNHPNSIVIDTNDNLYIADEYNHRIIRYRNNVRTAEILVDRLKNPLALSFDNQKNLYVTCSNRVLQFKIIN